MADPVSNTRTKRIDYEVLVRRAEGGELHLEHAAYEFSKKTFKETDAAGVYKGEPYDVS